MEANQPKSADNLDALKARQQTETDGMNERHSAELAAVTDAAAKADKEAAQKAEADALAAKHADEIAAAPKPDDVPAQPDAIALAQLLAGPGDLVLNGAAAKAGAVTLPHPRRVVITSAGDDRAVNWTVVGTGRRGPLTDTFAGANAGDVRSSVDFLTVSKISGSAGTADVVAVGVGALAPQWEPLDEGMVAAVAHAMAQAHHGADVADANGYMELARSLCAGARAGSAYREPKKFVPAAKPADKPVEATKAPTPTLLPGTGVAPTTLPAEPRVESLPLKQEPVKQQPVA